MKVNKPLNLSSIGENIYVTTTEGKIFWIDQAIKNKQLLAEFAECPYVRNVTVGDLLCVYIQS